MIGLQTPLTQQRSQFIFEKLYPYTEELLATGMLLAGLELNLLQQLSETNGHDIQTIAQFSQVEPYRIHLLLNGLIRLEIIQLAPDGLYYLTKGYGELFDANHPAYCADICAGFKQEFLDIFNLKNLLQNDDSATHTSARNQKQTDYYQSMVLGFNHHWAQEMLSEVMQQCTNIQSFLDLGGGHGYYSILLLNLLNHSNGHLIDLPNAIEFCKKLHGKNPAISRLKLHAGNALHFTLDEKVDFIMLNDLLHYFSIENKAKIIQQCISQLNPGGVIAVSKFYLQDDEKTMTENYMFSVKNFIQSKNGYLASDRTIKELLHTAGLQELHNYRSTDGIKSLLIYHAE